MSQLRKDLNAGSLWADVREIFDLNFSQRKINNNRSISITDCLISACAMFSFKLPSLLQFDKSRQSNEEIKNNLKTLFQVSQAPSDTYMREQLDTIDPRELRTPYKQVISKLQRGKALEPFRYLDDCYLVSLDGTGHFSSNKVHCENCCEKHHRNGTVTYYHQMLSAAIVHPDIKIPIPLCPEAITKQDGDKKNDCERNASKRVLNDLRREHPHMKIIIIEDGLASNAPHIQEIKALNMHYILGAKQGDHKSLFEFVNAEKCEHHEHIDDKGTTHRYRFLNEVSLNKSNPDCIVNFIQYWETKKNGDKQHFAWVTDFFVTQENCYQIMRGGRARWRTENEIFNTLKNQGYEYEHNFGHGEKNLSTVFSILMMLAFLIDQVQLLCCPLFQKALEKVGAKTLFWEKLRFLFQEFLISSWEDLFLHVARIKRNKNIIGGNISLINST